MTKEGYGFGYGTTDKISPEDAFLKSVFDLADPKMAKKKKYKGMRDTIAQLVPEVPKKDPKPVDPEKALILSCRNKMPIDRNGMPIIVESKSVTKDYFLKELKNL